MALPNLREPTERDLTTFYDAYTCWERALACGQTWRGHSGIKSGGPEHLQARAYAEFVESHGGTHAPYKDPLLIEMLLASGILSFGDAPNPHVGDLGSSFLGSQGNSGAFAYRNATLESFLLDQKNAMEGGGTPSGGL